MSTLFSQEMPFPDLIWGDIRPSEQFGTAATDNISGRAEKDASRLMESFEATKRTRRRQNTTASARFRQRRKEREEELTKKYEILNNKFMDMEKVTTRLTAENNLLKGLLLKEKEGKCHGSAVLCSSK